MTNSAVPYSFVPGTKAKANEVNANFNALVDIIEQNKAIEANDISDIKDLLKNKADKSELIKEYNVNTSGTNLNNYLDIGTYVFKSPYLPSNIPKNEAGILFVTGVKNADIKQIWICSGANALMYVRDYVNGSWNAWKSVLGGYSHSNGVGYYQLPNGFKYQWGFSSSNQVVYPLAYSSTCTVVVTKIGWRADFERSDTGVAEQYLTGFTLGSAGVFYGLNWHVMGV